MHDVLPDNVYEQIEEHLILMGDEAEEGWDAGNDEEDTLTGHLGAKLQTRWSPTTRSDGRLWKWKVSYKKFRGRGPKALKMFLEPTE